MLFILGGEVIVGQKKFDRILNCEVERDLKTLSDKCVIELPTTAMIARKGEAATKTPTPKAFAIGEEAAVKLGYNGRLNTEFRGFVTKIEPLTPTKITLEDETYLLKRKVINEYFERVNFKELIKKCIEGTGIETVGEVPSITLHRLSIRNANAAKVLQTLCDDYGLTAFFPLGKNYTCH